ncbi:DUF4255 domain-containing protein [Mariniflexile sp. AS56]|uniref:DUF4255 domain-containing protein n=1 Tax=Mariniflexile sp. AS56 TaxID=3063957 RepID=UPI0026ECE863|nr:DUF4255 domain-containing protein [Mariniflexile sp. AS56]MDO7174070.1 DUF4255 domain-containing protein [Mariniflexile sp. AS56]
MIYEVLKILKEELDSYFQDEKIVSLENIAAIEMDKEDGNGNIIVLSLINVQEEFALKNISNNYIKNTEVNYRNPKVNLNLYTLFSSINSNYEEALKKLTKIIEFFQGKMVFTQDNTNFERQGDLMQVEDFEFIVRLYTPTFEELNFIWGTLGGKQFPSVIYKITLLKIERGYVFEKGELITEVNHNFKNK